MTITGNIVDIPNRTIFHGILTIEGEKIVKITPKENYFKTGFKIEM